MGVVLLILKILLYIILAVLGIILIVLAVPVGAEISFIDEKLSYKIKVSFLNVTDSNGGGAIAWFRKRRKTPQKSESDDSQEEDSAVSSDAEETPDESAVPDTHEADEEPDVPEKSEAEETIAENSESHSEPAAEELRSADNEDSGDEDDGIPSGVKSAAEKIASLLEIWNSAKYPIKKIFKGIHLSDVYIDLIAANEDAYDCALKYGRICAVTYNGLAVLGRIFDLRIKTVDINPGFSLNKSRWDVSVSVSFRLGTLVISGIWFLMTYIFRILLPKKLKERKLKKTAAVQE